MNTLYYGDNLFVLRELMKAKSVDLVYLDPPFNSQQNYNLLYKTMTGKPVPEQAEAFCDTWEMDATKERLARTMPVLMREMGVEDYYVQFWDLWMRALRNTQPHLLAYLIYMVERLLYLKLVLKSTGSIYLHCDPTASHYIKVMMDGIFGHRNFRSEVVWKRTGAHGSARRWGPVHDTILFYSMSDKYTWNPQYQQNDEYLAQRYTYTDERGRQFYPVTLHAPGVRHGSSGEQWHGIDITAKGGHWKYTIDGLELRDKAGDIYWPRKGGMPRLKMYLDEAKGAAFQDVWTDVPAINSQAAERLGYPTQKPMPLLKRIIESSSKPGDVVLDPFCGCGTTIYAAQETGRQWIGMDVAILAIRLIRDILTSDRFRLVEGTHFSVDGIPASVEQADELCKHDPFQFESWAVERVGGFPTKKTGDHGIDGRLYFEAGKGLKSMVISVKGGVIRPTDIRDLRGVLERENEVEIAGFISLREPSKAMKEEAAVAGQYEYSGVAYDRIQLLTVREILEGHRDFHSPTKIGSRIATGQSSLAL